MKIVSYECDHCGVTMMRQRLAIEIVADPLLYLVDTTKHISTPVPIEDTGIPKHFCCSGCFCGYYKEYFKEPAKTSMEK
jgi:hypothetical protein